MKSKIMKSLIAATASVALVASLGTVAQAAGDTASPSTGIVLNKKVVPIRGQAGKPIKGGTNTGITYHGGPVMTAGVNVYPIWYGTWTDSAKAIINNYLSGVGNTARHNINTTYYNGSKVKVSRVVTLKAGINDTVYSKGKALSDAQIQALVTEALTAGTLPKDANGLYFVLTSGDVTATSGFLTQYCGWHTYTTVSNTAIKYSFVGDPSASVGNCAGQTAASPNNNIAVDAMISVIQHELEETATDPQLNAWYDSRGYENSDKCAWQFGTTSTAGNGSKYNVTVGSMNYLVQMNWVNAGSGGCLNGY